MADDIAKRLAAPFPPEAISWRIGATNSEKTRGLALAYIDARDVMNRLDDVLGVFGWQSEHSVVGNRTICRLSIRDPDTGEWVSRTDGAGDTDVEGEKGAFSDSLKRSAVAFGIGRYLYDVDAPWVEVEQKGSTRVIKESEMAKLRARLAGKIETAAPPQRPVILPRHPAAPDPHHKPPMPVQQAQNRDHPKRAIAIQIYKRVHKALEDADTPKLADEIMIVNAAELEILKEVSDQAFNDMHDFAKHRKAEMMALTP